MCVVVIVVVVVGLYGDDCVWYGRVGFVLVGVFVRGCIVGCWMDGDVWVLGNVGIVVVRLVSMGCGG